MITIRPYQPTDYPAIKHILTQGQLFDDTWDSQSNLDGMVEGNPEAILVAIKEAKAVGCIYLVPLGPKATFIFRLAVHPDHRNQGIATKLIEHAQEILRKRGVSEIGLFADTHNQELQSFYFKRHFQTTGTPWIYLWKPLSSKG